MSGTVNLSVLLTKSVEGWTARCLEYDVAGQGDTIPKAVESLSLCFAAHILANLKGKRDPFADIPEAPKSVWKRFEAAERIAGERPLRMPSATELPPELRDGLNEPWRIPRTRASELRVC